MELRHFKVGADLDQLRQFLAATDPNDYLLGDLLEWSQTGRFWVGEEDGKWVAFGRLHDLGEGEGWVSGMRVQPNRRRQGLGGQLLNGILEDARTIGLTVLRAVIEDPNTGSRRLFEQFGFRPAAAVTLRRGLANGISKNLLHQAQAGEAIDGPVGWLPSLTDRVDLLPGSDGGRLGGWRAPLLTRWATEGKLYLGLGLAVAVQTDWSQDPRTLWVNPLRGNCSSLLPAMGRLTAELEHEEWQGYLPSTEPLRAEYASCGAVPHPHWGDRVHLYERFDSSSVPWKHLV